MAACSFIARKAHANGFSYSRRCNYTSKSGIYTTLVPNKTKKKKKTEFTVVVIKRFFPRLCKNVFAVVCTSIYTPRPLSKASLFCLRDYVNVDDREFRRLPLKQRVSDSSSHERCVSLGRCWRSPIWWC